MEKEAKVIDLPELLCFGEVLYDVYPDKKVLAGAPLNTASVSSVLGLKSAIVSSVNEKDLLKVNEELRGRNVVSYLQANSYPTGRSVISLDENGLPSFKIDKESAYDYIKASKEALEAVADASFVYFGTLSQRNEVSRASLSSLISKTNATLVYDINLRKRIPSWEEIVKDSISKAQIVKLNESEEKQICRLLSCKSLSEFLFAKTRVEMLFVTKGKNGAELFTPSEKLSAETKKVDSVDTTGCGDAFTAGVIHGLKKGLPNEELLEHSIRIASVVVKYKGAFSNQIKKELQSFN